jgi:hypothetical protein
MRQGIWFPCGIPYAVNHLHGHAAASSSVVASIVHILYIAGRRGENWSTKSLRCIVAAYLGFSLFPIGLRDSLSYFFALASDLDYCRLLFGDDHQCH